jgi:hypothetical protein
VNHSLFFDAHTLNLGIIELRKKMLLHRDISLENVLLTRAFDVTNLHAQARLAAPDFDFSGPDVIAYTDGAGLLHDLDMAGQYHPHDEEALVAKTFSLALNKLQRSQKGKTEGPTPDEGPQAPQRTVCIL